MPETKAELISTATKIALQFAVDPILFCALIENESSWNPLAYRYEEAFYEKYIVPMNLSATEGKGRAASYGLCQVLGEVARELGFREDFSLLSSPDINLYLGCKKLKRCLDQHGGLTQESLLAYNGGGDPGYPARVIARMANYMPQPNIEIGAFEDD